MRGSEPGGSRPRDRSLMRFALAAVVAGALDLAVLLKVDQWIGGGALLAIAYLLVASAGAGVVARRHRGGAGRPPLLAVPRKHPRGAAAPGVRAVVRAGVALRRPPRPRAAGDPRPARDGRGARSDRWVRGRAAPPDALATGKGQQRQGVEDRHQRVEREARDR